MDIGLKGRHVAILAAEGVDTQQVTESRRALVDAGAAADVVGVRVGDRAPQTDVVVERTLDECHATDFDALVIPGGGGAVRTLRGNSRAVQFVKEFMAADKPVAAIGEGVAMLVAADVAAGRAVAADAAVADEARQAGAKVIDASVHVDDKLITARGKGDVSAVSAAIAREFAIRVDDARVDELSEQSFPASDPPPGPMAVGGGGASEDAHLEAGGSGSRGRSSSEGAS